MKVNKKSIGNFIFLLLSLTSFNGFADEIIDGIIYYLHDETNTATVYGCEYSGNIIIPQIVDFENQTYTVTEIGLSAFNSSSGIISIDIPASVVSIREYAFKDCVNLKSVYFQDTGKRSEQLSIKRDCFNGCSKLEIIQLPNNLNVIPDFCFNDCINLKEINIPESVEEIGKYAFYGCSNLETIRFSNKLHIISDYCFSGCTNINEIDIPDSVEEIGKGAFNKTNISKIVIPPSVKLINNLSFPESLKLLILLGNATIIEGAIFQYGTNQPENPNVVVSFSKNNPFSSIQYEISKIYALKSVVEEDILNVSRYSTTIMEIEDFLSVEQNKQYDGTPLKFSLNWPSLLEDVDIIQQTVNLPELINAGKYKGTIDILLSYKDFFSFSSELTYEAEILKALLTINILNTSKIYGEENPSFDYNAEGFFGLDNKENSIKNVKWLADATLNSEVGDYQISMTAEADNYSLKINPGILKITKAPLYAQVKNAQKVYGEKNPGFSCSFTGFKFQDNEDSILILPSFQTQATEKSDVGEYPIIASNGEFKNYEITNYAEGILTVTKAPLIMTANNVDRAYYSENPFFSYTLSGLLNGDDKSCIIKRPSYSCTATLTSDCGEYKIIPSEAEAKNYDLSYIEGTLTVTPASLIMVASDLSREYGDSNPVLKYEALGLKGDDNILNSIVEEPILFTNATEGSNVGEYAITISGGSSKNYTLSYRQGILTVTKAPLTVIAEDAEREYGEDNPTFTREYLGFKLNDTETSAFSSLPRIMCAAIKTSDAGEYPITVESGTSRNYELSEYQNGTLTITKAPIVLTASDKSRLYYESNPQFDYTIAGLKNNDTKASIGITPVFECSAILNSNAGQYPIVPSGAEAKNYTFDYRNGTLTVNQRSLSASVGSYTRKYNSENPEFEVEYSGFVNDEDEAVMNSPVTVTCDATKTSDVDIYPLTLSGGEAINYTVAKYTNGSLTIEKADQALNWNQDLSNIELYSQVALTAISDSGLDVTYEMSPNNVATLYSNAGVWYLDCYGSGAVSIRAIQNGNNNYNAASMIAKTLVVNGTGNDPSNPQIYLDVPTAGTLPNLIAENRKYQIKNLRLTGYLNGTDINYIREMAGSDSNGSTTAGILETLDITGCTIVSGGRSYYKTNQTSNYKVGDYMFYNCKVLVNLMLPENTNALGDYALADCDRLSVLSIPNSVITFGDYAFRNDIGLLRVPMPNNLTSIGDMAFYGCNNLTELILPKNLRYMGEGIVRGCENIASINVESGNTSFASLNGVLYNADLDELLIFPVGYTNAEYSVSDAVQSIAPYAFYNAKGLKKVILPETLTTIGKDAFIGCVNLTALGVMAITPPICQNDCFESVSKTRCELQVRKGCYSYYWVAPVWSEFNKIVETTFEMGVESFFSEDVKVSIINGVIVATGVPENEKVKIFSSEGSLLFNQISNGIPITYQPSIGGLFIIVTESGKIFKVIK